MQQCMELTNTNRSRAYPKESPQSEEKADEADSEYFAGAPVNLKHKFVSIQFSGSKKGINVVQAAGLI